MKQFIRKIVAATCIFQIAQTLVLGQNTEPTDTSQQLPEITVRAYLSQQPLLQTPASVAILGTEQLQGRTDQSLLPALNLVPGVRMEERSPGSYRLSMRGSLLRSPFGVRNVKVYLDGFPLTDAGGNTYLNLLDAKAIERAELLKGPDGSLFGANSGGVVLLDLNGQKRDSNGIALGLNGGSYGLLHQNASLKYTAGKSRFSFNQGYQRTEGYRENTAMHRHFLQAAERLSYGKGNSVKCLVLYSDLQYRTPGGLTQAQFDEDPRQARPAAGPNPGAVEQKAGIYNKTLFAGITNELLVSDKLRYIASIFGSNTDFENPFITNYEKRKEQNLGIRTFAEWYGGLNAGLQWKWSLGLEGQRGWQDISNFKNDRGVAGALLAKDELDIHQLFYFSRLSATLWDRLTTELALSLNGYKYAYEGLASKGDRVFADQWMPRFAASYLLAANLALRATVSRGYSPPTLAEVRSSSNAINTGLQPESGWNKEAGFRWTAWKGRLQMDAAAFRYDLTDAIVRRLDENGVEYFVNAGGTKQTGLEAFATAWLVSHKNTGAVRAAQLTASYTYSHFLFENYRDATADHSGNKLTGVPQSVIVLAGSVQFPFDITLLVELNSTSSLPLNDANTVYADKYHLLRSKLSWTLNQVKKMELAVFIGADNLLNEKYSLGNDINAFGGRYFNAAAPLNVYAGINCGFYK